VNRPFLTLCAAALMSVGAGAVASAAPTDAMPRSDVRAIETLSQMPTADADLQMWSGAAATPQVVPHAARLPERAAMRPASGPLHSFFQRTTTVAEALERDAERFIGVPYVFGGTSPSGFDCSGYTQHVFAMLGIALPRTADAQFYALHPARGGAAFGDLVFFQTYAPGPSHVGIYLGGGRFIHSSSHGVMISRLSDSYWSSRYLGAKRIPGRLASR